MWVTRNKDGELRLWIMEKPERSVDTWVANQFSYYSINSGEYNNLKWEDDPIEVVIIPKEKYADLMKYVGHLLMVASNNT